MSAAKCQVCGNDARQIGTKNQYVLHRCSGCGQLFAWPPPETPLKIYSEKYFSGGENGFGYVDYDRDKEPMTQSFEKYLDLLGNYAAGGPEPVSLLDVGAATGFFLGLAAKRGWRVRGFEPCDYAANRARQKGLDVQTGILTEQAEPLDAITALDVIEHIPDPRSFVRLVYRSLRPSGIFAINTPDGGSLIARMLGVHWHAVLPPEHLQLFNRRSLAMLLDQEGFDVLEQAWIGKCFTLQYVFQTLGRVQNISLWSRLASLLKHHSLGEIAIPLNLRDNLCVIARKRRVW